MGFLFDFIQLSRNHIFIHPLKGYLLSIKKLYYLTFFFLMIMAYDFVMSIVNDLKVTLHH